MAEVVETRVYPCGPTRRVEVEVRDDGYARIVGDGCVSAVVLRQLADLVERAKRNEG